MKMLFALACAVLMGATTASAAGDPEAGQEKSATCAACHGADGNSASPEWPKLAGQHAGYLEKQLLEYQSGGRVNAVMQGMSAPLGEQDIADLAAYYADQTLQFGVADPELVELGETLYRGGDPARGIPACSACHGPAGRGNMAARFPLLSGQHADYTAAQLRMFRAGERANDPNGMMRGAVANLTDRQIEAVSSYIQGLRP
jgi:cytochrome c553